MTAFRALLAAALAVALTFLTLPVVAIFVDTSPGDLIASLGDGASRDALVLSLETTATAVALIVAVGTPAAYLLATRAFRGRALVVTLIELPPALQPTVSYGVAIVKGAKNPDGARRFVDGLVSGDGARILREAGFEKPR